MKTPPTHRNRRAEYDEPRFYDLWYSEMPLQEIAEEYGVSTVAVHLAAKKRQFKSKVEARRPSVADIGER